MDKKIRPVIKWTGGKYKEFALFAENIPAFERYIEPFFGGGGVFFALQPKTKAIINDKSSDLINFYKQLGKTALQSELFKYVETWSALTALSKSMWEDIAATYIRYLNEKGELSPFLTIADQSLIKSLSKIDLFNDESFVVSPSAFSARLSASIKDKSQRIKQISDREGRLFTAEELQVHFETSIKSGAYLFFRSLLNQHFKGQLSFTPTKAAANWYFVREFCYGSMFRYNAKGEFNIPYGGISYNRKNFKQKVEKIFSVDIGNLFKEVEIYNLDFEEFLAKISFAPTDFIFLDPPYDSEFSAYDQSEFSRQDQKRLADLLLNLEAKWMVVIKETPFIQEIYTDPKVKMKVFYKNYTYNIRGRNDRRVKHLIITNY
jgi:DNA adenine methylase